MMELKEQTCTPVCDEGLEVSLDMKWSVEALGNILKTVCGAYAAAGQYSYFCTG